MMKKYFLLILILAFFFPRDSFGAFFFIENQNGGEVTKGETFSTKVYVNTENKSVNSFTGKLVFDNEMLDLDSVSIEGGLVDFWLRNPSSLSSENEVVFEGIILNPGFTGEKGLVFGVNFKAQKTGSAVLSIDEASILANDGKATNLFASNLTKESTVTIAQSEEVKSPTLSFEGSKNYEGKLIEIEEAKKLIDESNPIVRGLTSLVGGINDKILTLLVILGSLALIFKFVLFVREERSWGRLYDTKGNSIHGASVELFDNFGRLTESTKTDFLGYFKFKYRSGVFKIGLSDGDMVVPGFISDFFSGQAYDGRNFLINDNSRKPRILIVRNGGVDGKEKSLKVFNYVDILLLVVAIVGLFSALALLLT